MSSRTTALQPLPQFTYKKLEKLGSDQHKLKVFAIQQLLRRVAAFSDYLDDVALPIPGLGEVVDIIAASPILIASLIGTLEQLGRRNFRGAFVEAVGSIVEAAVTAIPLIEIADLATRPILGKRTATMAREFVEQKISGGALTKGYWTTTKDKQAYYIEPNANGYTASYYGSAGGIAKPPLCVSCITRTDHSQSGRLKPSHGSPSRPTPSSEQPN